MDPQIKKLAKYKLGIFDEEQEVSDEELRQVDELEIFAKAFSGRDYNIDLKSLAELPGLKSLSLSGFTFFSCNIYAILCVNTLLEEDVATINSLQELEGLSLDQCKVKELSLKLPKLQALVISDSFVASYGDTELPEYTEFSEMRELDLRKVKPSSKLSQVLIENCRVAGFSNIVNSPNLTSVSLFSSSVDNKIALLKLVSNKNIRFEDDKNHIKVESEDHSQPE